MTTPYHIYIPTRGRVDSQLSLQRLPANILDNVSLVCPKEDVKALRKNYPDVHVVQQPESVQTIVQKRKWIAEYAESAGDKFWFQMDDDLYLYIWDGSRHTTFANAQLAVKGFFMKTLPQLTEQYPCVGFGTKGFALPGGVRENYHLGFVFGFSRGLAKKLEWDRVDFYEDIDYTLQVLKMGKKIAITYDLVVDQKQANAAGGISDERTIEKADKALNRLIELHPGIVSKKPPSAQHPFSNTKVSWAKAAALGKSATSRSLF